MEVLMVILDFLILAWLVGTWFWEGNHEKCRVEIVCKDCGKTSNTMCRTHN